MKLWKRNTLISLTCLAVGVCSIGLRLDRRSSSPSLVTVRAAAVTNPTPHQERERPANVDDAGFVTDGTNQLDDFHCVGTRDQVDHCLAARHDGFVTNGDPQLDDDKCVGTPAQVEQCRYARRGWQWPPSPARPAYVQTAPVVVMSPAGGDVWRALAQCESGGTNANTGNGFYGYWQFTASTWHSLGYGGVASDYGYGTQLVAAQALQARSGWGQWPACAAQLGLR